jgi:hemerythrin
MALVTWDASYSVKVFRCDEDHKKLFALLNQLNDAMKAGKGNQVVQRVVKKLADYTTFHFAGEEALLEKTKYPGLSSHRAKHEAFVRKVQEFQMDLKAGNLSQSISVSEFMKDWLTQHIKQTDQQYSSYLNSHGVS